MKVLIHTLVWKRPEVTELTYRGFDRIQQRLKEAGIESEVLITSSEPDHTARALLRGYNVFEEPNFPVATKYNNAMLNTLQYEWDYLFEMDSNNLLSDRYIQAWIDAAREGKEYFGLRNFIALHQGNETCTHYYTRAARKISKVGRGSRRDLWEEIGKTGRFVHNLERNSNLDGMTNKTVGRDRVEAISYREFEAALDIKTGEDIHVHTHRAQPADLDHLVSVFPELKYWL